MMENGDWPNKNRPGVPKHSETDGWHLLLLCGDEVPEPARWWSARQQWEIAAGTFNPSHLANEFEYFGPVADGSSGEQP